MHKLHSFLILLFLANLSFGQTAAELTKNGVEAIKAQDANLARENFQKAITEDSSYYKAYYNMALLEKMLKNNDEALFYFKKVIEYQPNHVKSMENLAAIYYGQNNLDEALKQFEKLASIKPENPVYANSKGMIYLYKKEFSKAVSAFDEAIAAGMSNGKVFYNRGYSKLKLHQDEEGKADIEKSLELTPDLPEAHLELGIIYVNEGKQKVACEHLNKAKNHQQYAEKATELLNKYCTD